MTDFYTFGNKTDKFILKILFIIISPDKIKTKAPDFNNKYTFITVKI